MDKRLNPNLVWVFALAAAGITYGLMRAGFIHSNKALDIVVVIVFGGLGGASTFFTEAKTGMAATAMAVGGLLFAVLLYLMFRPVLALGVSALNAVIYTWLAIYTISALVAGIGGAIGGRKFQGQVASGMKKAA